MSKPQLFDSTVALTFYNLLCKHGRCTLEELHQLATAKQHPTLELEQAARAVTGLVTRAWVREQAGSYAVRDKLRRIVATRDTSGDQAMKGIVQGGWDSWKVLGPSGLIKIEEAAEGLS